MLHVLVLEDLIIHVSMMVTLIDIGIYEVSFSIGVVVFVVVRNLQRHK
jgi:hypothetical protein